MATMRPDRRGVLAGLSATLASASGARGARRRRLVVVGGGVGGATAARYASIWGEGSLDVTLVEAAASYTTCFFSNLYLGGLKPFGSLVHGYDALTRRPGLRIARAAAEHIDRERKLVELSDGMPLPYDRLILSPGIDLDYASVPGYSEAAAEVMPHAWKAGPQTRLLKSKLDAVPDGGLIVMIAPPNPYRCPPGPYERVSMMAHALRAAGKPKARIIVLDPKDKFSKMALFQEGWDGRYPGVVEWQDPTIHGGIKGVDPSAMTVTTDFEERRADLVNVIPAQRAGWITRDAGLANATGYCPIDPSSMRSTFDPSVFVVGDAAIAGDMPKSGFAANSQAKVAALAALADLAGAPSFPARYESTCWSLIAPTDCVKVDGVYEARGDMIKEVAGFVSDTGEPDEVRRRNVAEADAWYAAMTADVFG
ncbi:NADPH-dependent 2,4-dienoyl-CoA reductase/sulfur reductase-like enzyme [Methylopila capsulata]|uniref:Cytochrome c n=2 Tax=Methylopila capsulata TaxID=61654 RepID=A0A9W6ITD4_9HYPH|nr:NAD(P)/FAD-dependent oxidoreductase [Methylopila capsulata]MBM7851681.1 NADPH-dependent 2,4-dienoyl-CoA reductase/sulfur reductase-like enzyme [Methylopila capsulata]GLK54741.1 cytochrome c [Methylopila capsulata]